MRGPRTAVLRERLQAEKLLAAETGGESDHFDSAVDVAVAEFQRRIGLEADGMVGPLTLRELNYSAADRIARIRANMERWRWLSEDLGKRHIRVNIADFRLETWEDRRPLRTYDVIVGRTYRKTPVFTGEMTYLVLNPWWVTPHNIARLDKLRDFKAEPESVQRLGFEVLDSAGRRLDPSAIDWKMYSAQNFPFRLRQRPGPQNAMGRVKMMLPNKHNVYLHDTPSLELFDRLRRDFSSGCIRVQQAPELAEWVLSETPGWNRERIEGTIAAGRETRIDLVRKLPVHILYMTVVARPDGGIRFVPDLYDRDPRVIAALDNRPLPNPR